MLETLRSPRRLTTEILAGLVTSLALIPEVVSFAVIAGVDPKVALYTSCIMAMTIAFVGGRPAMVSAAAGATALVIAPLVASHGLDYLIAAVWLAGALQIVLAVAGVAKLMRFIPRSVMIGFVNALAILIFTAQLRHLFDVPWAVYPLVAGGIAMIVFIPKLTTAVPAALIAIVVLTGIVVLFGLDVPDVADQGELPGGFPTWMIPDVPLNAETLRIIAPYAVGLALVGLMESLMTAKLVDDITETPSHKGRESWALGVSNILAGFYGGIAGCAMIGQTVLNVKTGQARTRISTLVAGVFLLALVTGLSSIMAQIPMVALAAVMMVVAVTTVDWHSVKPSTLKRMPIPETIVMGVTVAVVVMTGNLAYGVLVGVILAMVLFARRVAHVISVNRILADDGESVRYEVEGPLFFGSSNDLVEQFAYAEDPASITIDLSRAQIWDASTVAALDSIETKYGDHGATVTIKGLDERSTGFHRRLTGHLGV